MESLEPGIDIIREVYNEDDEFITVKPWAEVPGIIHITTETKESEDYFGKTNLTLSRKHAIKLSEAIIACANELI